MKSPEKPFRKMGRYWLAFYPKNNPQKGKFTHCFSLGTSKWNPAQIYMP